jgi:NADH dehydrogenase [ubiquinone] 1 alpha subcomplex assembly factor 7
MFGELIGLWLTDIWTRAGAPYPVHYVELGPGRGTLARDALRVMPTTGHGTRRAFRGRQHGAARVSANTIPMPTGTTISPPCPRTRRC